MFALSGGHCTGKCTGEMEDRNPSPPPEVEKDPDVYLPDNVGDTAISKQWVLATLMEIINVSFPI